MNLLTRMMQFIPDLIQIPYESLLYHSLTYLNILVLVYDKLVD